MAEPLSMPRGSMLPLRESRFHWLSGVLLVAFVPAAVVQVSHKVQPSERRIHNEAGATAISRRPTDQEIFFVNLRSLPELCEKFANQAHRTGDANFPRIEHTARVMA